MQGQKYIVSKIYLLEDTFSHDINSFLVDPYGSLPSRTLDVSSTIRPTDN